MPKSKKKNASSKRQQKLFDNLLKATYEFIKGRHYSPQTKETLIERLNIHDDHFDIFDSVLHCLKGAGKVNVVDTKYHHAEKLSPKLSSGETIIQGVISVHPRGFGFINRPSPHEDVFIPKALINNAVDGDLVEAIISSSPTSEKGPDGRVVSIIERRRTKVAGTVTDIQGKTATIYSSLLGEMHPITCRLQPKQHVKRGDRVILAIGSWGQKKEPTECSLHSVLGPITDPSIDIPFAITENTIREAFTEEALQEAKSFGSKVKNKDLIGRRDLRDLECVTIDPETARDFDDAISVEQIGGTYRVGVHIADVSHYVRPSSAIDNEAKLRSNSTYFPGYCVPMLPRELSENLCSLKPNVLRLTVSVFFNVAENGETSDWEIVRSVIKSQKRFTYGEAKKVLDGQPSPHAPLLQAMSEVCNRLKQRRTERGSVQLYVPELVVMVDEKGSPTGTSVVEYDITHQMVEECMLKANEIVAIQLGRAGKDVSYRVHEEPAIESLRDFASLASSYGYHLPETPSPQDIQRLFQEIEGSPSATHLAVCYIKSMRQACYSPDNIGHYGLSLEHYCHFTSPIRRYIDLIIHRMLFEAGPDRETLSLICQEASEKERNSARSEGSVITMKKLRLLDHARKKNPSKTYSAVITRVKPFGISFDIVDLMFEGFLHVSELEDDYFLFDDTTMQLEGCDYGHTYGSGDSICVLCSNVDLIMQEASWTLVSKRKK